ncbi:MAG TPA: hypothetical protein PLP27_09875 [Crocinitomicaceae bacterium]|nr:hypothetical protein [Crocinitomicaceae bacterium]
MNKNQEIKKIRNNQGSDNYPILTDKGKVTMLEAKLKAETEYEKFRVIQDKNYESDFDKLINETKNKKQS